MTRLDNLNEDVLLYIAHFLHLCDAVSLSQTCQRFLELATLTVAYWSSSLPDIKTVYLTKVHTWQQYTARELRDAAVRSRNSDLLWNHGPNLIPTRWSTIVSPRDGFPYIVPGTRWLLFTHPVQETEPTLVDCYDLQTGVIVGSFSLGAIEVPSPLQPQCIDGKGISPDEIKLLFVIPREAMSELVAVYKLTFTQSPSSSSSPDLSLRQELVFTIERDCSSISLSDDGNLLAIGNDDSLLLIDMRNEDRFEWMHGLDEFDGEIYFHPNEVLVAACGLSLVVIHAPSALQHAKLHSSNSEKKPPDGTVRVMSLSGEGGETLIQALEDARDIWLLPPNFSLATRHDIREIEGDCVDIAWLELRDRCRYIKVALRPDAQPSARPTSPSPTTTLSRGVNDGNDEEGANGVDGSSGIAIRFEDQAKVEDKNIVVAMSAATNEDFDCFVHQRTIMVRSTTIPPAGDTPRIHVIGTDKQDQSRKVTLPDTQSELNLLFVEERTGVMVFENIRPDNKEPSDELLITWFV